MRSVQAHASLGGQISGFGVSRILRVVIKDRRVDVGCNGSVVWVTVDLHCLAFPPEAVVYHAPLDSYNRAKLLEDGSKPHTTGDAAFDAEFLVLGVGGDAVVELLTREPRAYLLTLLDLNLELHGQEVTLEPVTVNRRVLLRSHLDLRISKHDLNLPRLGEPRFTPEHVSEELIRVAGATRELEHRLRGEAA